MGVHRTPDKELVWDFGIAGFLCGNGNEGSVICRHHLELHYGLKQRSSNTEVA